MKISSTQIIKALEAIEYLELDINSILDDNKFNATIDDFGSHFDHCTWNLICDECIFKHRNDGAPCIISSDNNKSIKNKDSRYSLDEVIEMIEVYRNWRIKNEQH